MGINFKVSKDKGTANDVEIPWNNISKIGDIVLLAESSEKIKSRERGGINASDHKCPHCGFENEADALYCADCGKKMV